MNLKEAYEILNISTFSRLAYVNIQLMSGTGICDCISIRVSLQKKEDWGNGIFHNSPWGIFHIFCSGQREKDNDTYHLDFNNHTNIPFRRMKGDLFKITNVLITRFNGKF